MTALQLALPPDQLKGLASALFLLNEPIIEIVEAFGLPAAFEIAAADVAVVKLLPLPLGLELPDTAADSARVTEGPLLLPRLEMREETRLLALRFMLALCARLLLLAGGPALLASVELGVATCHVTPLFRNSPELAPFFLLLSIALCGVAR